MIREATVDDIPALLVMCRRFHEASPYGERDFVDADAARTLEGLLTLGRAAIFVCDEGEICGMMGVAASPTMFDHQLEIVQETFWWCQGGDAQGLRQAGEEWARDRGAALFSMACLENDRAETMARLYRRSGYAPVERHFIKAL